MASLRDIRQAKATVTIRGEELTVKGISGRIFFHLLDDFPEMRKALSGSGIEPNAEILMAEAPAAIGMIVALATGENMDDKKAVEEAITAFDELGLGDQIAIVKKIWDLTFPTGVASFIAALEELGKVTGSGWGQGTLSPGQSSSSSPPATPQPKSGNIPPE